MREPNGTDGTWLTSFALVVSGLWLGYTARRIAVPVTGSLGAAQVKQTDPYEKQISEMSHDIFRGLENRLAFEAWADERNE